MHAQNNRALILSVIAAVLACPAGVALGCPPELQNEATPPPPPELAVQPARLQPGQARIRAREVVATEQERLLARADVAVYEVALSDAGLLGLDARELEKLATLPEFDKAVRNAGDAKLLYRFDQSVDLAQHAVLETSADRPVANPPPAGAAAKAQTSYSRWNAGVQIEFGGGRRLERGVSLDANLNLSAFTREPTSDDAIQSTFHKVRQNFDGIAQWNTPIVLLNLDNAGSAGGGRPMAYVTRIVLREPPPQVAAK